jgi:hypothetical protein
MKKSLFPAKEISGFRNSGNHSDSLLKPDDLSTHGLILIDIDRCAA